MLLWKRYGNNKMAAMRIMSLILHLQQYSHRLNLFFFENRAVFETMSKNIVERSRPQIKIWRMRFVCWIANDTKQTQNTWGYPKIRGI